MKEPKCHRCVELQQEADDAAELRKKVVAEIEEHVKFMDIVDGYVLAQLDRLK